VVVAVGSQGGGIPVSGLAGQSDNHILQDDWHGVRFLQVLYHMTTGLHTRRRELARRARGCSSGTDWQQIQ
jgi:hypothetical protein